MHETMSQDVAAPLDPSATAPPHDPGASRRFFLAGTGALAMAATAGATTGFSLARPGSPSDGEPTGTTDLAAGTVIAYIRPGESEVTIISGDREVVVDDAALARRIAREVGGR